MTTPIRIAADIGGTFTDIVAVLPDGRVATRKLPSTPDDYGRAVVRGVLDLAAELAIDVGAIGHVLHGCTVATNAILELKGARTALITTAGFRDVLELRRIRVPRLYDPLYVKPEPLVPRNRRFEVRERIAADGTVVTPLHEDDVAEAVRAIRADRIEAVAVCFLHSYANPDHERRVGDMLRRALPGCFVTLSVDVLPEIREYERTSTTVINAYVGPPVAVYIRALSDSLAGCGVGGELLVMQSSGGVLDADGVVAAPARIVECGPAAGVIGAAHRAAAIGVPNVISFDMGGTTAKASLIEDGRITRTDEYEVGGGISLSSRLIKGGGYALKLPVIDISEVGAGGGSLVWIDRGGALKVGPRSAGAVPGPACYGLGGRAATVTDANVVLGLINPTGLAGGSVPIDAGLAAAALGEVAARVGTTGAEAAWWVHVVATSNMVRAVKAVSTFRGRNPADFTLMAFGGNGGIFAAELARQLGIATVLVPPAAGVFSAVGLVVADVEFSASAAFLRPLSGLEPGQIEGAFRQIEDAVAARFGERAARVRLRRSAAMRYVGQAFELPVAVPAAVGSPEDVAELGAAFGREHARTYGHELGPRFGVEIVALDVVASVPDANGGSLRLLGGAAGAGRGARRAYFGPDHGWLDTPVIGRGDLTKRPQPGPLIVEEYEGTAAVPPTATAALDEAGNIVLAVS